MAIIRNRRKPVAEMNVVPYIDVMLVLLVIFMVTAPMLNQGVKVDLPKVGSEALPQDNNAQVLTISIKADKTYYWNMGSEVDTDTVQDSALTLEQMTQAVTAIMNQSRSQGKQVQVFVRGDKAVDYGAVMADMGGLQQAGVGNISGFIRWRDGQTRTVSQNGVVGHNVSKVKEYEYVYGGDLLAVFHSDGLSTKWDIDSYPGLATRHPTMIAAVLYRDFKRVRDDNLIVVVKTSET